MKNLKPYSSFLNEAELSIPTDPKLFRKSFDESVKTIEGICSAVLSAKDLKQKIQEISKQNKDLGKSMTEYMAMVEKSNKLIGKIKKVGLSNNPKKGAIQLRAIADMSAKLKVAFDNLKTVNDKVGKAMKQNEGVLNVIGNVLRNLLTGKFIVNLISNMKQNLVDTSTSIHKVEDVFDINDY